MKIDYEYSHLGGKQILQVGHPEILKKIHQVIGAIGDPGRNKISKEKTMMGRGLYAPIEINAAYKKEFNLRGFNEMRDKYDITIPGDSRIIKGAFKQVDFVKDKVLVEVQFGKYAFMFYDMAKFQYFYNESKAEVGVEIVPSHNLQKQMSSGVSYGEQLVYDIERLKKHFPAVPVYVILVDF